MIKRYKKFLESSNTNDMWNTIPNSIKEIHELFKSNSKKLYLVGGSVRDFLKGDDPKDFDLCTDATPDEIMRILNSNGYRTTEQGKSFGVIVVYTDDQPDGMEIATFRVDEYDYDSRNPKIKFSTIDADVLRRDLSINALFYDLDKREIIDLVGGLEDIDNKIVRMVGNPKGRIKEDPLRIMRVIRFAYRYGFDIEKYTFNSIKELGESLSRITNERIWEEIKKSFSYKGDFKDYLDIITNLSLWEHIFPRMIVNKNIKSCEYLACYMANLFIDNDVSKLEGIMTLNFKIESSVSSKSCFLIRLLGLSVDGDYKNSAHFLYKNKIQSHVTDEMILDWMSINDKTDSKLFNSFISYRPTVSSEELMSFGFKGEKLGNEIKRLESERFKMLVELN